MLYKDVGGTLKTIAWIVVFSFVAVFAILGIVIALIAEAPDIFFVSFILLFGLIGYVIGQLFAIQLYAYGELVECVTEIKKYLLKLLLNNKRGCKLTVQEKRRIPGMGSSVRFFSVINLWKTILSRNVCNNHSPKKSCNFLGHFSSTITGESRSFLHRHLLQVVLVKVKTAGYQP